MGEDTPHTEEAVDIRDDKTTEIRKSPEKKNIFLSHINNLSNSHKASGGSAMLRLRTILVK
jgi:hypothetical protein